MATTFLETFQLATNQTEINDAKDDPRNILKYIPSVPLAAIGFICFLSVTLIHTWSTWKFGGRYMLAMVIGGYFYAAGLAMRFAEHNNPDSIGLYIGMNMQVTLAPCGFIAAMYMLLGRLAVWLRCTRHLALPAKRVTLVFVCSDVVTFMIQAGGGGISSIGGNTAQLGAHIFFVGLLLQLISFVVFTAMFLRFLYLVRREENRTWCQDEHEGWRNDWRSLAGIMCLSCLGILVRSFYRSIELAGGYQSHLSTTEGYFYGLDTLPLFCAILVYVPFWPGRFIPDGLRLESIEQGSDTKVFRTPHEDSNSILMR